MPALTFAGLRNTLAFVSLVPIAVLIHRRSPMRLPSRQQWVKLAVLGLLLYGATQGTLFLSLSYLPATTTNLLWTFSTVAIALLGIVFLSERPTLFQWTGISIATMGAVFYFGPANLNPGQRMGILVSLLGVFTNAGAVIMGRDVNRSGTLNPMVVTVISMGVGSLALISAALVFQGLPHITLLGWAIICWLAFVNALGFTLWNYTLRTLSAAESSIINGTMMIWIPILAVIFLHERLSLLQICALVAVGIGTLLVQLRKRTERKGVPQKGNDV